MLAKVPIKEFNKRVLLDHDYREHPDGSLWWAKKESIATQDFVFVVTMSPSVSYATIIVFDPNDPPSDLSDRGRIITVWLKDKLQEITNEVIKIESEMAYENENNEVEHDE